MTAMKTLYVKTIVCTLVLASLSLVGIGVALADENHVAWPPAPPAPGTMTAGPASVEPLPPPSPYNSAWPAPGQDMSRNFNAGRQDWTASQPIPPPAQPVPAAVSVVPELPRVEQVITSTWYFRQESFYWNERADGQDFMNERGPLSTLGYVRRNNFERFRIELFGGSVAYDGGAQYEDGTYEAYHQSNGTNYLGLRGEYDILFEPACWPRIRFLAGIGTRFWFRNLNDAVMPSGNTSYGYQETWWTFFPYVGLETRDAEDSEWNFFGSARFGITPLTRQYINMDDTVLYPKCGVTGQAQVGVRYRKVALAAYIEAMTWGESAVVRDIMQPTSRMLTIGGQLSYTF
jgi:hypothetical protein